MGTHDPGGHEMASFSKIVLIMGQPEAVFESLATLEHIPRWAPTPAEDGGEQRAMSGRTDADTRRSGCAGRTGRARCSGQAARTSGSVRSERAPAEGHGAGRELSRAADDEHDLVLARVQDRLLRHREPAGYRARRAGPPGGGGGAADQG